MASLETLVKNTSKLIQKIENEVSRDLEKRIRTLIKGVASELNTQLKGKPLSMLSELSAMTDKTTVRQLSGIYNLKFSDTETFNLPDEASELKIKKIVWNGDFISGGGGSHECELEVFYAGSSGIDSIYLLMEFTIDVA